MKKVIIYLIAVIILVSTSGSLFAQVTFRMKRAPLNQLRSADLWNATIINTGETFTAYLYGSLTNNENSELIATGQTMTFEVKKGTTNFKVSDLPKIPDVSYLAKDPKYKQSFMNTGGAPPGDYKICCELRRTDNTVAGEDCFDQKITGGDAPQLISPRDEEEIRIDNPVFTWMHTKAPGSNQTYTLRIVELKESQSPDEAMKRNKAFFEKEGISPSLFQYPASAPKFEAGKKYAWMVKVGDLQSNISIYDRWGIKTLPVKKSSLAPFCTDFEDGTPGGWQVNNALKTIKPTGGHPGQYIETTDQSGSSYFFNVDSTYTGNWGDLMTDSCGSLCFDVNYIYNGDDYYYTTDSFSSPPLTMQPYIAIEGSGFAATFITWNIISVGDGWHTYCAPLKYLNSDGTLPSNSDGHWVMTPGSEVNWNSLLSNVTKVRLRVDVQNYQNERIGYDNICIKNTGDCVPPPDHGSICDSLKANAVKNDSGKCCWKINLTHPQNTTGITGIQFLPISPNLFIAGSMNLGSGYTSGWFHSSNTIQNYTISRTSGTVPPGQLNGFFNFCINAISSPQTIAVNWLRNDTVICADTVKVNCDIPCVTFTRDTIVCNGNNYSFNYAFTNNSGFAISNIEYSVISPSGTILTPSSITLGTPVPNNQNSSNINIGISNINQDTTLCILMKFKSADTCCWCYDTICVRIPSCICDKVGASLTTGDIYNCCYTLNLFNNYAANYFTSVNLTCITPGVTIASENFNSPWGDLVTSTTQAQVTASPSFHIPSGTSNNIGLFCFTGYTTTPQKYLVQWMRNDSVKCTDTLTTNCVPPYPKRDTCSQIINDTIICLGNGTFQYNFQVQNNSTFINATGFKLNVLSPLGFVPSEFDFPTVTMPPNTVSPPQSLIISGLLSGATICFDIALYNHQDSLYTQCCHSDTICKTMPNCSFGGCLDSKLDSIWCIKDPTGVKKYGYIISLTNLTSTIGTYVLSNSCGTFLGNNSGSIPASSTISVSGQFSTSQTGSCCIYTEMFLYTPVSIDTCYDTLCFSLPNCDSIIIHHDSCDCGKWENKLVKLTTTGGQMSELDCGSLYNINSPQNISFSFPNYICTGLSCNASYQWKINGPQGPTGGLGNIFSYLFSTVGTYNVTVYAYCGAKLCDSCTVTVNLTGHPPDCDCGDKWSPHSNIGYINPDGKENQLKIGCFEKIIYGPMAVGSVINYNANPYVCNKPDCIANYKWNIIDLGSGSIVNSGTTTTLPVTFTAPPESKYRFTIYAYCGDKVCDSCGFNFSTVGKPDCDCGKWASNEILVTVNDKPQHPILCGAKFPVDLNSQLTLTFPAYICNTENCATTYLWDLTGGSGIIPIHVTGTDGVFNYLFNTPGSYILSFKAYCGGRLCDSCVVRIVVTDKECDCGGWAEDNKGFTIHGFNGDPNHEIETFLSCGKEYSGVILGTSWDFVSQTYKCVGKLSNCNASYNWTITSQTGILTSFNTQVINSLVFNELGTYTINLKVSCNGKICDSCISYFNVIKPVTNSCVVVTKDSIWCLGNRKYGFKLWIDNQSGHVCSNFTMAPDIAGSGNMNSGFITNNIPTGISMIVGSFTDVGPVNNPFCLRLTCNDFPFTCSTVHCLPLPGCP
jgi:hypothetical protein